MLQERHSVGEMRRIEEQKKQKDVSEWLTKSVQKTKIHKIVEEQNNEQRTLVMRTRAIKEN